MRCDIFYKLLTVTQQITKKLITGGEGLSVEFKACRNRLNRDVYQTVCAFLNRHGGTLLLGIDDLTFTHNSPWTLSYPGRGGG